MNTLSSSELERFLHPAMAQPSLWRVVRYELEFAYTTGRPEAVALTFRSASGAEKRLRFVEPRFQEFGPLQVPDGSSLYVADLSSLGWERDRHVEVGEWDDDRTALFWAKAVEEAP